MRNGHATIIQYKGFVAGWLDSSVADFLAQIEQPPPSMSFALITCLDSDPEPASLLKKSRELRSLAQSARPLGNGLLLPTERLLEANSRSCFFFGFDEIWFFPSNRVEPKSASSSIVGPKRVTQLKMNRLGRWMKNNQCSLGLGDGEGLNVVVETGDMLKYLIGHSLSQPGHLLSS